MRHHILHLRRLAYLLLSVLPLLVASCIEQQGPTVAQRRAQQQQDFMQQLANEQRTLHVTDSLIAAIVPQINAATAEGFDYEKSEYDDLGRFRPKGSDPADNVQRTYLRSAVDDYGRTQLICTYCGPRSFTVVQLRATASDGTSLATRTILPNDGSNYAYDISGTHYQSVTFAYAGHITEGMTQDSTMLANADTDNGLLAFLASHASDSRLQVMMVGANGREQRVAVSQRELQGMAATHDLGLLLRESVRLQQENKTASLKVTYLQTRIGNTQ